MARTMAVMREETRTMMATPAQPQPQPITASPAPRRSRKMSRTPVAAPDMDDVELPELDVTIVCADSRILAAKKCLAGLMDSTTVSHSCPVILPFVSACCSVCCVCSNVFQFFPGEALISQAIHACGATVAREYAELRSTLRTYARNTRSNLGYHVKRTAAMLYPQSLAVRWSCLVDPVCMC